MILKLEEAMTSETLDKVISCYNDIPYGGVLTIYLNSIGGEMDTMQALLSILHDKKDITTLVGYGELSSAAFALFFLADCKRQILPGTLGMFHLSYGSRNIDNKGRPAFKADSAYIERAKTFFYPLTIDICTKIKMNKSELKKINLGEDVFFQYPRMCEFLNNSNNPIKN